MNYFVSGTRLQLGAIGIPDNFQESVTAESSREAFLTVLNRPGYEHVQVIAIKIECPTCHRCHMIVDPNLYLYA